MPELDYRHAAAEYAAGELASAECARFEEQLRADPALEREIAFWRDLRTGLRAPAAATAPTCPDLSQALLRRAALERQDLPARRLRLPRWTLVATAAAACLALGFGFAAGTGWNRPAPLIARTEISEIPATEPVAYAEDGSGMIPPPAQVSLTSWMPLSSVERADATRPLPMTATVKPWIGIWTKQAKLVITGGPPREAHLVVRIVEDSPAWQAGLRSGDMIVSVAGCTVTDATCLGQHLAFMSPGSTLELGYWSGGDAAFRTATVTLTAVRE